MCANRWSSFSGAYRALRELKSIEEHLGGVLVIRAPPERVSYLWLGLVLRSGYSLIFLGLP